MTLNCKGTLIDLSVPKVLGILNLTPDSFYDGGAYGEIDAALHQVEKMIGEGAFCIDVGAYSSRPGATNITADVEQSRLLPVLEEILKRFPDIFISVDTFRASVAQKAIEIGAAMVNDISAGLLDPAMIPTVGKLQVPYVMMHMRGTPQTMKELTVYEDVVKEVIRYFSERLAVARTHKINDIIVDPGFGFAKTISQNFELLNHLNFFKVLDVPILAGISRKSMIYKTLDCTASEALNGTTALHIVALQNGAKILRAHDVKEAMECVKLYTQLTA